MAGRLRQICRGENIAADEAAKYRALWASQPGEPPAICPHRSVEALEKDGEVVTVPCETCPGKLTRLKVFACYHPSRMRVNDEPDEVTAKDCQECEYRPRDTKKAAPLLLVNRLCPGDITCMTAAIWSLHRQYPGKFATAVQTNCDAIFEHNPDVVPVASLENPQEIEMAYPAVNSSNQRAIHQLQGYCEFLSSVLGINIPLKTNRPRIWLSRQEWGWMNQVEEAMGKRLPYWVVNSGFKRCFTTKHWPYYQEVVDRLQGRVLFVQVGKSEHVHAPLRGVLNLLDNTDDRQFLRLIGNSQGVLCGLTWAMHAAAAFQKPAVILAGGREPKIWNTYPVQTLLNTVGQLDCCRTDACWRSRVVALGDNDEKDKSLCDRPALTEPASPSCMAMISADEVVSAILRYEGR